MERRNFLGFGLLSLVGLTSLNLSAEDYRKTKPDVWTAHTNEDAITKLFGTNVTINEGVILTVESVAVNGANIPIDFQSSIPAKSVALFQSANPESAVCAFTLNENTILDYSLRIKMKQNGIIMVVVEGLDGKLYSASKSIIVSKGGCEG